MGRSLILVLGFIVLSFVAENSYEAGEGTNYTCKRGLRQPQFVSLMMA
jgi:hypothetical protein